MKLSEIYESVQGEGPRVGEPTIFVRFAGCNLRCPGWPCDTQHAIDPAKYRFQWRTVTYSEVLNQIRDLPHGKTIRNICLTGGEPFLQARSDLEALTRLLLKGDYKIEAFTNGAMEYPTWAFGQIAFNLDWKLPGSGENMQRINPVVENNIDRLIEADGALVIKFTVKDKNDFDVALERYKRLVDTYEDEAPAVYCGPVWGCVESTEVLDWIIDAGMPWRLNTQLHKYLWHPEQIGV